MKMGSFMGGKVHLILCWAVMYWECHVIHNHYSMYQQLTICWSALPSVCQVNDYVSPGSSPGLCVPCPANSISGGGTPSMCSCNTATGRVNDTDVTLPCLGEYNYIQCKLQLYKYLFVHLRKFNAHYEYLEPYNIYLNIHSNTLHFICCFQVVCIADNSVILFFLAE